jgi:hypothetical protein
MSELFGSGIHDAPKRLLDVSLRDDLACGSEFRCSRS